MPPTFFIVGPTAVGKTTIAIAVAKRCGAEIVNADAFQLYAGLDVLTAKPSPEELRQVPHHLIGVVPLAETYNVARYAEEAHRCLDAITRHGRPAIVVGGSGMYIKALTHGLSPLPPAQPTMRAVLEAQDTDSLRERLRLLDPATAEVIDAKNRRRLVRAIEVCVVTGRRYSDLRERWTSNAKCVASVGVFLVRSKADLDNRIKRRVEEMFADGVIEEARAVCPQHISETASRMIGWREVQDHLRGNINLTTCIERIEVATRRYAKRQMTWFRSEKMFEQIILPADEDAAVVADRIYQFVADKVTRP